MTTSRWIVDTDGRDGYRVAEYENGRTAFATEAMSLERCEQAVLHLRGMDAQQLREHRRQQGIRLQAQMRSARELATQSAKYLLKGDPEMTAIIELIERTFVEGRDSWVTDDSIDLEPMLEALEVRGYDNDSTGGMIEASITDALIEMRAKWGNAWSMLPGECAEAICRHLYLRTERPVATIDTQRLHKHGTAE